MPNVDQTDSEELVRRAASGDRVATEQLLGRCRKRLRRMVTVRMDQRLVSRIDPSDVVQEVLLEASRKLPAYSRQPQLPFYPWLRQLAWERLIDLHHRHVGAQKRSVNREHIQLPDRSADQLMHRLIDTGTSPNQRFLRNELRERVQLALSRLDPQDREVLVMRHLEQMAVGEIAALLGLSEGAVKMRRLRAVQRLRDLLDAEQSGNQP